jgi:hypothetical protein
VDGRASAFHLRSLPCDAAVQKPQYGTLLSILLSLCFRIAVAERYASPTIGKYHHVNPAELELLDQPTGNGMMLDNCRFENCMRSLTLEVEDRSIRVWKINGSMMNVNQVTMGHVPNLLHLPRP